MDGPNSPSTTPPSSRPGSARLGVRAFSQVAPLGAVHAFATDKAGGDATTHPNGPQTLDALRDAGVETILI